MIENTKTIEVLWMNILYRAHVTYSGMIDPTAPPMARSVCSKITDKLAQCVCETKKAFKQARNCLAFTLQRLDCQGAPQKEVVREKLRSSAKPLTP